MSEDLPYEDIPGILRTIRLFLENIEFNQTVETLKNEMLLHGFEDDTVNNNSKQAIVLVPSSILHTSSALNSLPLQTSRTYRIQKDENHEPISISYSDFSDYFKENVSYDSITNKQNVNMEKHITSEDSYEKTVKNEERYSKVAKSKEHQKDKQFGSSSARGKLCNMTDQTAKVYCHSDEFGEKCYLEKMSNTLINDNSKEANESLINITYETYTNDEDEFDEETENLSCEQSEKKCICLECHNSEQTKNLNLINYFDCANDDFNDNLDEFFSLDYEKIKDHLLNNDDVTKELLLQALRWRITQTCDDIRSYREMMIFVRNDLLNLSSPFNTVKVCLERNPDEENKENRVQENTARLLNCFASLRIGRDYLCQDDDFLINLLIPMVVNGKFTKKFIQDMMIATLQKLSLRKNSRLLMISEGVIQYLVSFLMENYDKISKYGLEYSTALLMNLCLQKESFYIYSSNVDQLINLSKILLANGDECCVPYINAVLFIVLRNKKINVEAKRSNLGSAILHRAEITEYEEVKKQLEYVYHMLNNDVLDVCLCNCFPETLQEVDLLEPEIDSNDYWPKDGLYGECFLQNYTRSKKPFERKLKEIRNVFKSVTSQREMKNKSCGCTYEVFPITEENRQIFANVCGNILNESAKLFSGKDYLEIRLDQNCQFPKEEIVEKVDRSSSTIKTTGSIGEKDENQLPKIKYKTFDESRILKEIMEEIDKVSALEASKSTETDIAKTENKGTISNILDDEQEMKRISKNSSLISSTKDVAVSTEGYSVSAYQKIEVLPTIEEGTITEIENLDNFTGNTRTLTNEKDLDNFTGNTLNNEKDLDNFTGNTLNNEKDLDNFTGNTLTNEKNLDNFTGNTLTINNVNDTKSNQIDDELSKKTFDDQPRKLSKNRNTIEKGKKSVDTKPKSSTLPKRKSTKQSENFDKIQKVRAAYQPNKRNSKFVNKRVNSASRDNNKERIAKNDKWKNNIFLGRYEAKPIKRQMADNNNKCKFSFYSYYQSCSSKFEKIDCLKPNNSCVCKPERKCEGNINVECHFLGIPSTSFNQMPNTEDISLWIPYYDGETHCETRKCCLTKPRNCCISESVKIDHH